MAYSSCHESAKYASAGSMESTSNWASIRSVPPPDARSVGLIVCASTVTHARPSAIVIACGLPPTVIVASTLLVRGSIRVTVPSPLLATHTEPAPTATPAGERPTGIVVGHRLRGRVDPHDGVVERVRDPHPTRADRDPRRSVADRDRRQQPGRVDARDVVGLGVGQPNGAVADSDRRRARIRIDLLHGPARSSGQGA